MTFQYRHMSAALLLHLLVFGLLVGGVQCTQKVPPTRIIHAVLYDPSREQIKRQEAEDARRQRERQAAEKRRQEQVRAEAEKKKQAEAERKKAEEEAARKKAEAEAQRKQELAEKQARDAAERREADRKSQLQRELAQENLRRQLEREALVRDEASMGAKVNEWAALVTRHIQKNWIRPSTSAQDFSCTVRVALLPDGSVTSARVTNSCGNPVLDKSVADAVYRSSPIPRPTDPAAFVRDLNITFVPK